MLVELQEILANVPALVFVVDKSNRIKYTNNYVIDNHRPILMKTQPGYRPGDAMHCVNAMDGGACMTTEQCAVCGIPHVIVKTWLTKKNQRGDVQLSINQGGQFFTFDFRASTMIVKVDGDEAVLLMLQDISAFKRIVNLERIFFHDILNLVGSLDGVMQLVKHGEVADNEQYFKLGEEILADITDEILGQRQIVQAENGELKPIITLESTEKILDSVVNRFKNHYLSTDKTINIRESLNIAIKTDPILIKRILTNMLKNALESSKQGDIIDVGCRMLEKSRVNFYVCNKQVIPYEIQLQLFQRSFSTKGQDRGLGTYSMKLLGETYLKGNVYFRSEHGETEFGINLPMN